MQAIFTIFTSAIMASTMVSALPAFNSTGSCNNKSTLSCCNTNEGTFGSTDLLGGVLDGILGGSCDQVNLIGQLSDSCPGTQTFCCPIDQDGLINISATCLPVTL